LEYPPELGVGVKLPVMFPIGERVTIMPTQADQQNHLLFSVSPALPPGLELDATTGVITGSPSTTTGKTVYTITARNRRGQTAFAVAFAVAGDWQKTRPKDWSVEMCQMWLKNELKLGEERSHLLKLKGSQLMCLQSPEAVASQCPAVLPALQVLIARSVVEILSKWDQQQGAGVVDYAPEEEPAQFYRESEAEAQGQPKEAVNGVQLEASRHSIDMSKTLGSGSFADVRPGTYRFPGQGRPTPVAYKVFRGGQNLPPPMKKQIVQELALGVQLNHPNLTKIYGFVEVPQLGPALVLELASRSLRAVLDDTSRIISWKMCLKWLSDIACGMRQLHSLLPKNIIHRDLKAANILLDEDMTVAKITDFGVAMTIDTLRSTASAGSGAGGAAGTMAFKAPESFDGVYSVSTDVYAYAIMIYEVCTRRLPYADLTQPEILDRARQRFVFDEVAFQEDGVDEARQRDRWNKKHPLSRRRPDLSHVLPGCPEALDDWMIKCWADDASNRPVFSESVKFLKKLQEGRPYWGNDGDGQRIVLPEGKEKEAVVEAFKKSLPDKDSVIVLNVERIQNPTLWDTFAAKRGAMLSRLGAVEAYERVWLFHGCPADIVSKIVEQGFNRSFTGSTSGRALYGKGVYFAQDASYSMSPEYSPPVGGKQRIFMCRVLVGEFCKGRPDALTPDARQGDELYDSTVDTLDKPSIFVTYHDAQAYPDYFIEFTSMFT